MVDEKHVLLVDDDEIFSDILRRSLEREGYAVGCASSIPSAIYTLENRMFHYAVVDLRIGNESGLVLVKDMKQLCPMTKVIVLTGYSSIATAVEAIKLGAIHYLTKPAEIDEIIEAFEKIDGDEQISLADNPLSIQRMEWEHIQSVLQKHDGNISATARAMGMHRRTLQRKLQKRPVKK